MAKSTGLGMRFYIGAYGIHGDVQAIGALGGGPAVLETTGIDKLAFERIGGRRDGRADFTGFFNPETIAAGGTEDRAHLALKSLPLTDRIITIAHLASGETWNSTVKQINYDPTVQADGAISIAVNLQPNGFGVECGKLLTPAGVASQSGPGSLASLDLGVSATRNFGLQAHLHVLAFAGTSATVTLQESNDDGVGDAWAAVTDGAFAVVTGPTSQRIQTARDQTVERYLRVTTTGTFSQLVFVLSAEANLTQVLF